MPITVSIVEDNDQLRDTLARMISRAGRRFCKAAVDGSRAIADYGPRL